MAQEIICIVFLAPISANVGTDLCFQAKHFYFNLEFKCLVWRIFQIVEDAGVQTLFCEGLEVQ